MYKLNVKSHFSAAHQLNGYNGPCKNMHGHNWKVRICILCEKTDEIGLTIDFKEVKTVLNRVISELDHSNLNEHEYFQDKNPTSENIACFIYKRFKNELINDCCRIHEVEVCESDNTSMTYFE